MLTKTCKKCGIEKPISDFHKARPARGLRTPRGGKGVASWCKDCKAEHRSPGILAARAAVKARIEELAQQGLKECTKCGAVKPREEFHVNRMAPDGRAWRCPNCINAKGKKWREDNPDAYRRWSADKKEMLSERNREWRGQNRDHLKQSYAEWAKANPEKRNALIAKRNARKKHALVKWADQDAIRAIYAEAIRLTQETGVRYEVDHIYPLQGETVCGLHCEANLQILTKTENTRKKNMMPEEYEARYLSVDAKAA